MEAEAVLEFLRQNGYLSAEVALKEEMMDEKDEIGCFDYERFVFPMNRALPPVRVPARRSVGGDLADEVEEFVSLIEEGDDDAGCSSEFTNPYGQHSASELRSDASSDELSQFGTARDYHEFDMQTDLWHDDRDEGYYFSPISALDPFCCQSEDKFVTEVDNKAETPPFGSDYISEKLRSPYNFDCSRDPLQFFQVTTEINKDYCHLNDKTIHQNQGDYSIIAEDLDRSDIMDFKGAVACEIRPMPLLKTVNYNPSLNEVEKRISLFSNSDDTYVAAEQDFLLNKGFDNKDVDYQVVVGDAGATADEQEETSAEELPKDSFEDDYDVFYLRIIHRKNRTGFEENKDFPIFINTLIAGRYLITEYLGSATFSKVVQAHDIQTGVDVCLKIIKNDKDFFDQSLDEIKLLKYVNKHDPSDEKHILRLYDYFYHQEHLFIVCELLRANLYEFHKYNAETGGGCYFTMSRLQSITRQCLEAVAFLHQLGIIHCDLKPENILIKSYSRCEIKVIDLGSSCFLTDNLCLYVQSRSYRAPEVILGLPYGPKIDVWSLGCILAELCSGEVLFPNDAVVLLLARMIGMLGPIDMEMLEGKETHKYFTKEYDLYYIHEDTDQVEYIVPESALLEHLLPVSDDELTDFIKFLLQINPRTRPTAEEALRHPWLSKPY
ncbi:hypothetical protein Droror1_Dr00016312 [Drosera rotundifolia]